MPASFDTVRIGARVVVRARLDPRTEAPYDGPSMTDAVGELVARTATTVVVATRHGEVTIARHRIVAAKEIPPKPSRRGAPHLALSIPDLQRVMIDAWPPMERERLGGWHLHASRGFTGRGNSTVPLGDPGLPTGDAIDRVEAWYAARGLPATFSLAGPVGFAVADDPVGSALVARGYAVREPTLTLTAATDEVAALAGIAAVEVSLSPTLDADWLGALATYRPIDVDAATAILTGSPEQVFARSTVGDETVAIGRLGLANAWGGIASMWVAPEHRRRGLAGALLGALTRAAQARGIRSLHLQTDASNSAALALYESVGFRRHHAYAYVTSRQGACR